MDSDENGVRQRTGARRGLFDRLRGRHPAGPDVADGDGATTSGADGPGDAGADGAPAPVVDLDDATFEAGTEGGWTVVDFWAPWCGPCRTFHPVFDRVAAATEGVRFARCNVDVSPGAAGAVGIQSIPTVVLFDPDGNEVHRLVGVPSPRAFVELIHLAGQTP